MYIIFKEINIIIDLKINTKKQQQFIYTFTQTEFVSSFTTTCFSPKLFSENSSKGKYTSCNFPCFRSNNCIQTLYIIFPRAFLFTIVHQDSTHNVLHIRTMETSLSDLVSVFLQSNFHFGQTKSNMHLFLHWSPLYFIFPPF